MCTSPSFLSSTSGARDGSRGSGIFLLPSRCNRPCLWILNSQRPACSHCTWGFLTPKVMASRLGTTDLLCLPLALFSLTLAAQSLLDTPGRASALTTRLIVSRNYCVLFFLPIWTVGSLRQELITSFLDTPVVSTQ